MLFSTLLTLLQIINFVHSFKLGSERFQKFASFCEEKQKYIISQLELEDGGSNKFVKDPWERETGYGITAVIQKGDVIEKGAVSTTITKGILSLERAQAISSRKNMNINELVNTSYCAAALSIVLHSKSPMVPTFRADIRYFELEDGHGWFGGGGDLTPYYLFDEDATYFHNIYKKTCDEFNSNLYLKCKEWCDQYFYIPSRMEHRGVGGIFFDDLSSVNDISISSNQQSISSNDMDKAMEFTCKVCESFIPSYIPIIQKRKSLSYTEEQRHWQLLRRGRYIEFNMIYDRGVKFGLVPGGRIEAVMVSCPPIVAWDYNHKPDEGSEEERLMSILKQPVQWA